MIVLKTYLTKLDFAGHSGSKGKGKKFYTNW